MEAIIDNDCGIYMIKNTVNSMVYVGSSNWLSRRVWRHRRDLNKGNHFNRHLQNSWNKYGEKSFKIMILCHCALADRAHVEKIVADQYDAFNDTKGFNVGDPFLKIISPETRKRMSDGMKGVNTWMTGRKLSPESIAKRTAKIKGTKHTLEYRIKASLGKIGPLNPNYKITDVQCEELISLMKTKTPRAEIAAKFSVSISHVFNIAKGHRRSISQLSRLNGRK